MAPDFERLARTPWPTASLASSGIKTFSSALDRSCSRKAERVERNTPANSAQELEALMLRVTKHTAVPADAHGADIPGPRINILKEVPVNCLIMMDAEEAVG